MHNPFVPYDPSVLRYGRWTGDTNILGPWEYTNWIDETLSWKKTCYIHGSLSGLMANLPVKGPDAERLMSETFVNSFTLDKFPVGSCRQVTACSEKGTITMNGIALRIAEDHFDTYCLDPQIPMQIQSGKYNVEQYTPEYNKDFVLQLAAPKSLEIAENSIMKLCVSAKTMI